MVRNIEKEGKKSGGEMRGRVNFGGVFRGRSGDVEEDTTYQPHPPLFVKVVGVFHHTAILVFGVFVVLQPSETRLAIEFKRRNPVGLHFGDTTSRGNVLGEGDTEGLDVGVVLHAIV